MSGVSFKNQNLAERVADQLSETINRQGWSPGQKLPPVRDLARQFEVSPNTAHAAIQLLAGRGIIELQARQGAFIQGERQTGTRNQIGIIWPCQPEPQFRSDADGWTGRILRSAEVELHRAGYYTTILGYYDSPRFFEQIEPMRSHLAGVLTFARPTLSPLLEQLDQWDLPWITINAISRQSIHNFVSAANEENCLQLGRTLAGRGLRRVLVLTNDLSAGDSSIDKLIGLFEGFILAGASTQEIEVVNCGGQDMGCGHKAMCSRLSHLPLPQVVFTNGDSLAIGAIRACREHGVHVPEEIGVVGATGLRLAELSYPSLSVMAQPMEEMGQQAANMLIEMAREGTRRMIGRRIPCQFIVRESFVLLDEYQNVQSSPGGPVAYSVGST